MSFDAFIMCAVFAYVFPCFGILRFVIMNDRDVKPEHKTTRGEAFVVAFLWPVWLPLAIAAAFVMFTINGIWEVL